LLYQIIPQIFSDNRYEKTSIGESQHPVFAVEGAEHLIVIKTSKSRQELLDEKETTMCYSIAAGSGSLGRIVEPVMVSEKEIRGQHFFVTKRKQGKTLYELMDSQPSLLSKEIFGKVIDFMAELHFYYPGSTRGELNLYEKVRKNILDENLGIDTMVARNILPDIDPVLEALVSSFKVHNMDSHPENWIITDEGKIVKVDCARSYLVPCELELANLFIYKHFFKVEELPEVVGRYCEKTRQSDKEVLPRFYNAIILRAFALAAAWSDPSRHGMHDKRGDMLANPSYAIELLGTNHPRVYNLNSAAYSRLAKNFAKAQRQFA
jgi:thiamine kinase-like enzyme